MENFPKNTSRKIEQEENKAEKFSTEEGLDFIFEQNPILASIGTKETYKQYLNLIFPESTIKNILYHGTDVDFRNEGFKAMPPSANTRWFTEESLGNKFYFTDDLEKAERRYSKQNGKDGFVLAVVVDFRNPKDDSTYDGTKLDDVDLTGYDSYVQKATYNIEGKNGQYFVAFDPGQIHILGSNDDIEKFKEFVEFKK
ncbi:hypothetical protein IT397_02660 [Candidatus Nomurabacteria bacterium]|nr:hypothetical protein [Candidatus Nomurabacteria bacterium]